MLNFLGYSARLLSNAAELLTLGTQRVGLCENAMTQFNRVALTLHDRPRAVNRQSRLSVITVVNLLGIALRSFQFLDEIVCAGIKTIESCME